MSDIDIVAGLDIGTFKTCCVIAEVKPGAVVNVIGAGEEASRGVHRGVVVDIEQTASSIRSAVEKAQRMAGAQVSTVCVGITGEHVSSVNNKGTVAITSGNRQIRTTDVDRALENARVIVLPPDREIIHVIPRGFAIDGQDGVNAPVGMSGTRLEVQAHIVHGTSSFLENLAKAITKAGLRVEAFTLQSYASGLSSTSDSERSLGVVVIDMGGGTTDVAVFSGGSITYSGVVGVGGNNVTQDLAVGLQCTLAEAERVKIAEGAATEDVTDPEALFSVSRIGSDDNINLPRHLLVEIIEPRITETFQLIDQLLEKNRVKSLAPGGIVLTGGASSMKGAIQLATQVFKMPVRMGRLSDVTGLTEAVDLPRHATGVGLTIFAQSQLNNSFVSPEKNGSGGMFGKIKQLILGSDE